MSKIKKASIAGVFIAVSCICVYAFILNNNYQKLLNKVSNDFSSARILGEGAFASSLVQRPLCDQMANLGMSSSSKQLALLEERFGTDLLNANKLWIDLVLKDAKGNLTDSEKSTYREIKTKKELLEAQLNGVKIYLKAPFWKSNLDVKEDIFRACE